MSLGNPSVFLSFAFFVFYYFSPVCPPSPCPFAKHTPTPPTQTHLPAPPVFALHPLCQATLTLSKSISVLLLFAHSLVIYLCHLLCVPPSHRPAIFLSARVSMAATKFFTPLFNSFSCALSAHKFWDSSKKKCKLVWLSLEENILFSTSSSHTHAPILCILSMLQIEVECCNHKQLLNCNIRASQLCALPRLRDLHILSIPSFFHFFIYNDSNHFI